jgi:hypothetical protein
MLTNPRISPRRLLAGGAVAAALGAVALTPSAGQAAAKTQTLRFFSQQVSFTYTAADGTVTPGAPAGDPKPGDVFEIDSLDFRGDHRRHAKRATASDYLRCTFQANGEPDCYSFASIGGSLLRFHGDKVIGGTGRFRGATGTAANTEVEGGLDSVVRLRLP